MMFGSLSLLWLLLAGPATPAMASVKYLPAAAPFASTTLFLDVGNNSAAILKQNNVDVKIVAAEAEDLLISRVLDIECLFDGNYDIRSIAAWVDNHYHLIPVTIVEYKTSNPSYIKLEINMLYLTNNELDAGTHRIYINFF